MTFDNSIVGQQAANYYQTNQNVFFNQQVTATATVLSFVPYGTLGAKLAQLAITAGSLYVAYYLTDVSFPLAAGDNLYINTNTVKTLPYGTPTTTSVISITDVNGYTKYYNRSVR